MPDTKGAHGEIALGDLLAYAGALDQLNWTINAFHDRHGHAKMLAAGSINIAAMREAAAAIARMKAELAAKDKSFRTDCALEEVHSPLRY